MDDVTADTAEEEREAEIPEVEEQEDPGTGDADKELQAKYNELEEKNRQLQRDHDSVASAARREERGKREKAEAELAVYKKRQDAGPRPELDKSLFIDDLGEVDSAKERLHTVDYEDKLHEWRQAQEIPVVLPPEEQTTQTEPVISATPEFWERAGESIKRHPDYVESLKNGAFTQEMVDSLEQNETGPEIAYYLSKNQEEAIRISELPADSMNQEIGRLTAKFSGTTEGRSVSNAPDPIKPVGDKATVEKDPEKMTDDEWSAWDDAQQLKKLKAGG